MEGVHCVEHQFPVVLICSPQGDDSCCGGSFRKRHSDQCKSPVAQPRFRSASLQKLFAPAVAWEKDLKGKFLLHLALEFKALKSTLLEVEMTAVTMKSPSNANSMLERLLSLRGDSGTALRKRKFSENCANLLERSQRFAELLDALLALLVAWYRPPRARPRTLHPEKAVACLGAPTQVEDRLRAVSCWTHAECTLSLVE